MHLHFLLLCCWRGAPLDTQPININKSTYRYIFRAKIKSKNHVTHLYFRVDERVSPSSRVSRVVCEREIASGEKLKKSSIMTGQSRTDSLEIKLLTKISQNQKRRNSKFIHNEEEIPLLFLANNDGNVDLSYPKTMKSSTKKNKQHSIHNKFNCIKQNNIRT